MRATSRSTGIRNATARSLLLAPLAVLLVACGSGEPSPSRQAEGPAGSASPARAVPPEVGVVVVRSEEVALKADIAGRVAASQTAEIRPQVGGIVIERAFAEGSEVEAGDVLYRLDPSMHAASVASAEASLQRSEAGLASARARFDRLSSLSASRVVSTAERDDAEAAQLQAQADVSVARAAVDTARINLSHTTVTAPLDGLVGASAINPGSIVTANQAEPLAVLRQLDPVFVDFSEASGKLLQFKARMQDGAIRALVGPGREPTVTLTLANGAPYGRPGTIDFAEQFVSQTTGTFIVRSRFANPDRLLLPGMYVRGEVSLAVADEGILVPQRSVTRDGSGAATAMVVNADGTVETRVLEVMMDIGSDWLVTGGLADGDRLMVDGFQRVREGQAVTAVEVTIDPNGIVRPRDAAATVSQAEGQATSLSTTADETRTD